MTRKYSWCSFRLVTVIALIAVVTCVSGLTNAGSDTIEQYREVLKRKDVDLGAGVQKVAGKRRARTVTLSAPGVLSQPNTEYILDRDIRAEGTALTIDADSVTINLNGHTVTYDTKELGGGPKSVYGIASLTWGHRDIEIINGAVVQGEGRGSGNVVGWGHNPIFMEGVEGITIAGLTVEYSGGDIVGVFIHWGNNAEIHHNTFNDQGVHISNRHQGLDIIRLEGANAKIHHNLVKRCRHRAFTIAGNSEVWNNEINIDSHATNSCGVMCYQISDFSVHHNKIVGRGEHPIGVAAVAGSSRGKIFENYIDVQNTRRSAEYGSTGSACVRLLWGADRIEVFGNDLVVRARNEFMPGFNSWGRAVWVGLSDPGMHARFFDNTIIACNDDGIAKAAAVGITDDNEKNSNLKSSVRNNLVFEKNRIVSNWGNVLLGDNYGNAWGYTRFVNNDIVRVDRHASYRTIRSQNPYFPGTAEFIDNHFEGGASLDSIDLEFSGSGLKEVAVGWMVRVEVLGASQLPVGGAEVVITDRDGDTVFRGNADDKGVVETRVIEYLLTNQARKGLSPDASSKFGASASKINKNPCRIRVTKNGISREETVSVTKNARYQIVLDNKASVK